MVAVVDLVWLSLWAIAGWLVGILLFFIAPFAVHLTGNRERVNTVANHYSAIAMKLLGRAVLVERGTSYDLYQASRDGEKNADEFTMGGQTAHVTNEGGLLATLHKRAFGLLPPPSDGVADYVSPEVAELGRLDAEHAENQTTDADLLKTATLTAARPLVQLREYADRMIPGSRGLHDLDETIELYKQSQRLFGESRTTQFMILIIAYGAAMLMTWLIVTQAGGTVPDGGVSVGLGYIMPPGGGV